MTPTVDEWKKQTERHLREHPEKYFSKEEIPRGFKTYDLKFTDA